MTNIETFRDLVRRNLSFLFKHFIVEVREGTKIESRMEHPQTLLLPDLSKVPRIASITLGVNETWSSLGFPGKQGL